MILNITLLALIAACGVVFYLRKRFKAMNSMKDKLNGHLFKKMHIYPGGTDPRTVQHGFSEEVLTSEILNEQRWDEMVGEEETAKNVRL